MKLGEQSLEFLEEVWGDQDGDGRFAFISVKEADEWADIPVELSQGWMVELSLMEFGDQADLYFCPNVFHQPRRKKEHALPSCWLHADLDEVSPIDVDDILRTTASWQTSRGRYQCLWGLRKPVSVKNHSVLNQRLTYLTGADKGGWSVTKALRIPGTMSFKRSKPERVALMWSGMQTYFPKAVLKVVRDVNLLGQGASDDDADVEVSEKGFKTLLREHGDRLNTRAMRLLKSKSAQVGERSSKLWELECLLMEQGVPKDEAMVLLMGSAWNKYKGQARERRQLWLELGKAYLQAGNSSNAKINGSAVKIVDPSKIEIAPYRKFMSRDIPTKVWTVEGVWSEDAHGLMAGEPKTFKSFIATDLAVSVASGTPFLGKFDVPKKGPVIVIQEENTPGMMRDRLEKITASRGLLGEIEGSDIVSMPVDLPIHLVNCSQVRLNSDEHIEMIDDWMTQIEPKLVVLDPLYMMIPGIDESSQKELTPVLANLLALKQKHDCGMLLVHHYNKARENEDRSPMARLSGSGVLGRWFESVVYLDKLKAPGAVKMTTEHRSHAPQGAVHLEFDIGNMGQLDYFVEVHEKKEEPAVLSTRAKIEEMLREAGPEGMTARAIAEELEVSHQHVTNMAKRMGLKTKRVKKPGVPGRPPVHLVL